MADPLPPDPYLALGLPKDCTQAAVKTAHRKLVLKCHPDKVADPAAKAAASDQFHKIQTAYEILIDEQRRERYDAQVRLTALRKEKLDRQSSGAHRGGDQRSAPSPYKSSQENVPRPSYTSWEPERPTPQYEERRPSYASKDYFDLPPRPSVRKDHEYERSTRRSAPDLPKQKVRPAAREPKDTERERRREKTRKTERDTQRDRDRKYTPYAEDESESNSDEYERRSRKMREEDDAAAATRKAREAYHEQATKQQREAREAYHEQTTKQQREAREAYHEQATKQQREAKEGYFDDRTRKMFAQSANAWDHIRSSRGRQRPDSDRRPSPVRQTSSRDNLEYIKRKDGRPAVVSRRPSERPKPSTRDSESLRKSSAREPERRSSEESVNETRKPPTLSQSKSSPVDIRLPTDKPRAQSVQVESDAPEIPKVKRSETMPYDTQRRTENTAPSRGSHLRQTEYNEGLATPATTPEYTGYRTDVREPGATRPSFTRKVTHSPSPVKDTRDARETRETRETREPRESRERIRTASMRHPSSPQPAPPNKRTTSYQYIPNGNGVEQIPDSSRGTQHYNANLYGEIPPRSKYGLYATPPEDGIRFAPSIQPENIRIQSGGYTRSRGDRPGLTRNGSGNAYGQGVRV